MSTRVDQIMNQVKELSDDELMELHGALEQRRWTDDDWDRQMREDAAAGKFDALAEKAIAEWKAGESLPLPLPSP